MKQTRTFELPCQLRSEGEGKVAFGVVLPYDSWSKPIYGCYIEKFRAGAFTKHLGTKPDVYATVEHDFDRLLGRSTSGTLRLIDTPEALTMEVDLPKTSYANDLAELISRKDFRGMSFIFKTVTDDWSMQDKRRCCEISEAELYEVTFTANPYYESTTAELRSAAVAVALAKLPEVDMDLVMRRQWLAENA